jgi:hypothetical protein
MVKYTPPPFSTHKPGTCLDADKQAAALKTFAAMLREHAKALDFDSNAPWTKEACELATGLWEAWFSAASMRACMFICHKKDFNSSNCGKAAMIKCAVEMKLMPVRWATFAFIAASKLPDIQVPYLALSNTTHTSTPYHAGD